MVNRLTPTQIKEEELGVQLMVIKYQVRHMVHPINHSHLAISKVMVVRISQTHQMEFVHPIKRTNRLVIHTDHLI